MRVLPSVPAGSVKTPMIITWHTDNGAAVNLTGASLSARIFSYATESSRDATGAFNVLIPTEGVFEWLFSVDDVVMGEYRLQFIASYASGLTPLKSDQLEWKVTPSL